MKKILKFFPLTLPILASIGISIVVSVIGIIMYMAIKVIYIVNTEQMKGYHFSISNLMNDLINVPVLFTDICSMIIPIAWVIIFYFWYRKLMKGETMVNKQVFEKKNLIYLALLAIGQQLFICGIMNIILPHFEELAKQYEELMELMSDNLAIQIITAVILAPISEELICRGVVFKMATRTYSFITANILQAFLFGVLHMNIVQGIYAFIGGIFLGYVCYKYQSIIASMVLHLMFNAISFVLYNPTTLYMNILYSIVGAVIIGFAYLRIKKVDVISLEKVSMDVSL